MVFSLDHLVNFGGKLKNCEIPDSFRENLDNLGMVGILATIFFQIKA